MAHAIVTRQTNTTLDGVGPRCEYEVAFSGSDVRNGIDITLIYISIADGDTPTQLRSKLSTAVQEEAIRIGYSIAATRITLPAFTRG